MTPTQFEKLSEDLRVLATKIPLRWGAVQNNAYDRQIDMFSISSYDELETALQNVNNENVRDYFRRRWFLWQCSKCDEHIFCIDGEAVPHQNPRSKEYDIMFLNDQTLKFDVKGTIIPKGFRDIPYKELIENPQELANWMFGNQSKGVRYDIQNRLFIVHHSLVQQEREMYTRCAWETKKKVYSEYILKLKQGKRFISSKGVKADFIWLIEETKGKITPYFFD